MLRIIREEKARILAAILAIALILGSVSGLVCAAVVDKYEIRLTDSSSGAVIDTANGVSIKLTDKINAETTKTVQTSSGIAEFDTFVEDGVCYTVEIGDVCGYASVAPFELTVGVEISYDINLVEFEKVTVSGKVVHDNNANAVGATVKCTGYEALSTTTNGFGEYSFEVYKGKTYNFEASGAEKYDHAYINNTLVESAMTFPDMVLNVKKFNVTRIVDANGTITSSGGDIIEYGNDTVLTVTANEGYCIDTLTVNEITIAEATDKSEHTYPIENLKNDITITATFKTIIYKITINYNENGDVYPVTLDEDLNPIEVDESTVISTGGDINFGYNGGAGFCARARENYHINSLKIDDVDLKEIYPDDSSITYDNDLIERIEVLGENQNHVVDIEFVINSFTVSVVAETEDEEVGTTGGTAEFLSEPPVITPEGTVPATSALVDYDTATPVITITEKPGYSFASISVNGVLLDQETLYKSVEEGGCGLTIDDDNITSSLRIPNITGDTTVNVLFIKNTTNIADRWSEHLVITVAPGSIISPKENYEGSDVLILSKGSKATINEKNDTETLTSVNDMPVRRKAAYVTSESLFVDYYRVGPASKGSDIPVIKYTKSFKVIIDNTKPTIDIINKYDANGEEITNDNWRNAGVTIKGTVSDIPGSGDYNIASGVDAVVYSEQSLDYSQVVAALTAEGTPNVLTVDSNGGFSLAAPGEQNKTYYFYVVDKAGNVSDESTVSVKIDTQTPAIQSFMFDVINPEGENGVKNFLRRLSFGTLFKESIKVQVSYSDFEDIHVSSGVKSVELYSVSSNNAESYQVGMIEFNLNGTPKDLDNDDQTYPNYVDGDAVFKLTHDDFDKREVKAVITDYSGNFSESQPLSENMISNVKSNTVIVNCDKPEIIIRRSPQDYPKPIVVPTPTEPGNPVGDDPKEEKWYKGDAGFEVGVVTDDYIGIEKVTATLDIPETTTDVPLTNDMGGKIVDDDYTKLDSDVQNTRTKDASFLFNTSQARTVAGTLPAEGKYTLSVTATSNTGVQNTEERYVYIDRTAPNRDSIYFDYEHENGSPIDKAVHFLTFGFFCNEYIKITVSAEDTVIMNGKASGIGSITLYAEGMEPVKKACTLTSENTEIGYAEFIIPIDNKDLSVEQVLFDADISATATDNVGNTLEQAVRPTEDNSNAKSQHLTIETIRPGVSITPDPARYCYNDGGGKSWYNSNVDIFVSTNDKRIGDNKTSVSEEGGLRNSGLRSVEITLNDVQVEKYPKSFYELETKTSEDSATVNTKAATRTGDGSYTLGVTATDNAGNISNLNKTVYIDDVAPTIVSFDFEPESYVEGSKTDFSVQERDYGFFFPCDTKVKISAKDVAPSSGIGEILCYLIDIEKGRIEPSTTPVSTDNSITITVPANFKGQIYAKAVDNVKNEVADYVTPDSAVIEDLERHESEAHVNFSLPETSAKTGENVPLYKSDTNVAITVSDTYSGIRAIEWVVSGFNNVESNKGSVTINKDATTTGDDWEITQKDKNLVTEMKKTILVQDNCNDISVTVIMTDRAGNQTTQTQKLSIDTTIPKVDVTYNNNSSDSGYTKMYKNDRVATITVWERNFNPDPKTGVLLTITNTDGTIPSISNWTEHINKEVPDDSYYVATVSFSSDGDYTLDVDVTDLAGNKSADRARDTFTIDKTRPSITVDYDNNSSRNGNYFNADRTATITINEHNFNASRVKITGTADIDNAVIAFPKASEWTNSGDVHTARISYTSNANYTFDIDFKDMAGNQSDNLDVEKFVIDKTAPTLIISGVANESANKGTIAPVISYSDINIELASASINLSGTKGKVDFRGSFKKIEDGERFTYDNFEEKKEVDDIYTLVASISDLAGNISTLSIRFSANRFGSNYKADDECEKNIINKFIQTEQDIIIEEINVDSIAPESVRIKLIKNGVPIDLVKDRDYVINATGGSGTWCTYKYTIKKSLFADDGTYSISIYTVDAAGNINESIAADKKIEISFGVDKTKPVIVPIDLETGGQYPVAVKKATLEIKDNLVLDEVGISLNDKPVKYSVNEETYVFDIGEKNSNQSVKVKAKDAAGNVTQYGVEKIIVSTSLFVRWYNNKPLFYGSISGLVGLVALGTGGAFIVIKKKKEEV